MGLRSPVAGEEVSASGRSLPGSRRSHTVLSRERGSSSTGRGQAGAAKSSGEGTTFWTGRREQKKGVEREMRSPKGGIWEKEGGKGGKRRKKTKQNRWRDRERKQGRARELEKKPREQVAR